MHTSALPSSSRPASRTRLWQRACLTTAGLLLAGGALWVTDVPRAEDTPAPAKTALPTVEEARARAELLHEAMHATLHAVHRDFYREDEGLPIPATTMARVFRHIEEGQQVKLRWLAVEGQAMNVSHKPRDEFERAAAEAIKARTDPREETRDGVYRRAASITLTGDCLKCHVPDRKDLKDRAAGLVISIPLRK